MKKALGNFLRSAREELRQKDIRFSLRQVAQRVGVEPSYLSKVERGENVSLSEEKLIKLAQDLGQDPDVVLALSGRVSSDLQEVIRKRPVLFAKLIRELKNAPDQAVLRIVREVRDGEW
jgi:transcriptional regulator with XRE-family HTH domain